MIKAILQINSINIVNFSHFLKITQMINYIISQFEPTQCQIKIHLKIIIIIQMIKFKYKKIYLNIWNKIFYFLY